MVTCQKHPNRKAVRGDIRCGQCRTDDRRKSDPEFKAKQDSYRKEWGQNNKEYFSQYQKERKKRLIQEDPVEYKKRSRRSSLWSKYRLTQEEFDMLEKDQNGVCAICHKAPSGNKPLHVDHCHETGRTRGLLCHQCNWFMGLVDADPNIRVRLSLYGKFKNILERLPNDIIMDGSKK